MFVKYLRMFAKYLRMFAKYLRMFVKLLRMFVKYLRMFVKYLRMFASIWECLQAFENRMFAKYLRMFAKYLRMLFQSYVHTWLHTKRQPTVSGRQGAERDQLFSAVIRTRVSDSCDETRLWDCRQSTTNCPQRTQDPCRAFLRKTGTM